MGQLNNVSINLCTYDHMPTKTEQRLLLFTCELVSVTTHCTHKYERYVTQHCSFHFALPPPNAYIQLNSVAWFVPSKCQPASACLIKWNAENRDNQLRFPSAGYCSFLCYQMQEPQWGPRKLLFSLSISFLRDYLHRWLHLSRMKTGK